MPLVVPGIMTNPEDKNQEWANKLVGKTFSESESNETVSATNKSISIAFHHATSFSYERGSLDNMLMMLQYRCSARKTCRRRIASSSPASL